MNHSQIKIETLDGEWNDENGDPWIFIQVTDGETRISALDNDEGWYSQFTDASFGDGVFRFTKTDYLESGEDDEYSGIPLSFVLRINKSKPSIATVIVKQDELDDENFVSVKVTR